MLRILKRWLPPFSNVSVLHCDNKTGNLEPFYQRLAAWAIRGCLLPHLSLLPYPSVATRIPILYNGQGTCVPIRSPEVAAKKRSKQGKAIHSNLHPSKTEHAFLEGASFEIQKPERTAEMPDDHQTPGFQARIHSERLKSRKNTGKAPAKKKKRSAATLLDLVADELTESAADFQDTVPGAGAPVPASDLPLLKASVRGLVAFSLPDDTAWTYVSYADMREGSKTHVILQQQLADSGQYRAEVPLAHTWEVLDRLIEVSGRVDGIINQDTAPMLHEIKSTSIPLADIPLAGVPSHWAQLQCYAAIHAGEAGSEIVPVRLSYVNRQDGEVRDFDRVFTRLELARIMSDLLKPYVKREKDLAAWREKRNMSIQAMELPFPGGFRKGQKLLAYNVYRCIGDNRRLFAQAPTGTGKTMGALYPVLKAMGEGLVDRIFYVTAKTTTKAIAENAVSLLRAKGLRLKVLTLTAKDKMCLMAVRNCDPAKCPYAEGVFTRMQRVGKTLLRSQDVFSRDLIYETGLKHEVCPFELSLEISLGCDMIIADYNYVFDPRVYLKRFFQQKGRENNVFLVDEAHNLVDRAREMFSATLAREPLMSLRRNLHKAKPELADALGSILRVLTIMQLRPFSDESEAGGKGYHVSDAPPAGLLKPINAFLLKAEPLITEKEEEGHEPPPWLDDLVGMFFDLLHFRNTLELFGGEYRVMQTGRSRTFGVRLMCLDPSEMLGRRMDSARSCILFSATLSPLSYFRKMLGGRADDPTLRLPSPFPRENLCVVLEDRAETRFRVRERHLPAIASALHAFLNARKGNYLVYFPSYGYMSQVLSYLEPLYESGRKADPESGEWDVMVQESRMTEADREAWLARFERYGDVVRAGFCVLGGAFGEGIDLVGERLTGVAVVGVGLPQVNPEQEISRAYFEMHFGEGFDYAYTYPGLNRVLQAAGRLIRTGTDRGGLLLVDARFAGRQYQQLLPPEWFPFPFLSRNPDLGGLLADFWRKSDGTCSP
jgi:DNA excision repair protein ERCC-2